MQSLVYGQTMSMHPHVGKNGTGLSEVMAGLFYWANDFSESLIDTKLQPSLVVFYLKGSGLI